MQSRDSMKDPGYLVIKGEQVAKCDLCWTECFCKVFQAFRFSEQVVPDSQQSYSKYSGTIFGSWSERYQPVNDFHVEWVHVVLVISLHFWHAEHFSPSAHPGDASASQICAYGTRYKNGSTCNSVGSSSDNRCTKFLFKDGWENISVALIVLKGSFSKTSNCSNLLRESFSVFVLIGCAWGQMFVTPVSKSHFCEQFCTSSCELSGGCNLFTLYYY